MTQVGEGTSSATITVENVKGLYFLYFKLVDEGGYPIANIPYKTVKVGASAEPRHIAKGNTTKDGLTDIVSATQNEEIDFYIVWAKLTVNKNFLKT